MKLLLSFSALLLSAFSPQIEGYAYFVKASKRVCFTNETLSAITFVRQLPKYQSDPWQAQWYRSNTPVYKAILEDKLTPQNKDCNLMIENGCVAWKIDGFDERSNLQSKNDYFQPLRDRRWNDLPDIAANGSNELKPLLVTGKNFNRGEFHLSILAKESAQIILKPKERSIGGILIALDGWGSMHKSSIRECSRVHKSPYPACEPSSIAAIDNVPILDSKKWIMMTLKYEIDRQKLSLSVLLDGGAKMDAISSTHKISLNSETDYWPLYVRSRNYAALFKLHQYKYLLPIKDEAKLETEIYISVEQSICLSVTFASEHYAITYVVISAGDGRVISENELKSNLGFSEWVTDKIETGKLSAGKFTIAIYTYEKEAFIGDIRFCPSGPEVVSTVDKGVIGCQTLNKKQEVDIVENNQLTTEETLALCNDELQQENCKGVQFCNQKDICSCLSGFMTSLSGMCDITCAEGYYGTKCKYLSSAQCMNTKLNIHDGSCVEGCAVDYRPPLCTHSLLRFEDGPIVSDRHAHSVAVDLIGLLQKFKELHPPSETQFFGRAELQIRPVTNEGEEWAVSKTFLLDDQEALERNELNHLKPKTLYELRAVIFEVNNLTAEGNLKTTLFETIPCIPIDDSNIELKVDKSLMVHLIRLKDDSNVCHLLKYDIRKKAEPADMIISVSLINTGRLIENHEIDKPESATDYEVTVFAEDGSTVSTFHAYRNEDETAEAEPASSDNSLIVIVLIVSSLLIAALLVTIYIIRKRRKQEEDSINRRLVSDKLHGIELDLVPAPERSAAVKKSNSSELDQKNSRIVRISELEKYIDNSMKSDLLQQQHETFPRGQTQPWVVGSDPANKKKNRYANLAAYDATRVVLEPLPDVANSDYINANYIDGYKRPKAYIATQGPKAQTVTDFWRMVWQERVSLIIMVANVVENGKTKCEKYWPDVQTANKNADFTIRNEREEVYADFVMRTLSVIKDNLKRMITHLHFTTWPDHGVPLYPQSVAAFANKILHFQSEAPVAVHCSAGVGRTGSIILIDACLRMAKAEGFVDMFAILAQMRSQRANMVDNVLQYQFAHLVLLEALVFPQFEVPCKEFANEFKNLMTQKGKLTSHFTKLNEICDKEWSRLQKVDELGPEITASPSHLIRLYPYGSEEGMTVVNAVFIDGFRRKKQFIATEVPLVNKVEQFWRMVQQYKVEEIIVLNEHVELEPAYLPQAEKPLIFDELEVTKDRQLQLNNYQVQFCITKVNEDQQGTVTVVCMSGWKAGQLCTDKIESLVELWEETERNRTSGVSIVVCQDGVTASGLFLGLGFVLEKIKLEQQVDAPLATRTLRQARPKFLSSQGQYEILISAAQIYLQAFDTYGNFQ